MGDPKLFHFHTTLARNMAFLMKSIALGKEAYGLPGKEEHLWSHFVH